MKIQYMSDLHLELFDNSQYVKHMEIDPVGDVLNGAFATELGNWIATTRINAWIFGHSHANIDTTIGDTRIVCNQMGYVAYGEHTAGFDPNKFIEV